MKPLITIILILVISNAYGQDMTLHDIDSVFKSSIQIDGRPYQIISPYFQDSSLPSNLDTIIRRDSTLGIILFIDTTFVLRTAICLRVHSVLIIKYKPKWFYNADDLTEYLTLNDGRWIPDIDDNKWMEFIPSAQFQDYKVMPGVKNWEVVR